MRVFSPIFPGAAMAVDLNGDRKPDLMVADAGQDGVLSFINQFNATTAAAQTTTTLSSSTTSVTSGQALTLTAVVAAASGGTVIPTGSATFLDSSATLGSSALDASGKAAFTTSSLASGSHTLSAVYGGSSAFAGSSSPTVTVQVGAATPDFSASVDHSALTLAAGTSGTLALTLTPVNGSTQTVTVSCGGLPAHATCGFSPGSAVTLDGSQPSTVTITIATNVLTALGKALMSPSFASFGGGVGGAILVAGMLGTAIRRRLGFSIAAAATLLALASCGGGHSGGGAPPAGVTPTGTYPLTISLISGATTHTVSVTLTGN
jgi:Bacterial Ig-like domain (group 3)